jgi:hypothetical protein
MSDIIINVAEFQCESPIMGATYRDLGSGGAYIFNWTSQWDNYIALGLNAQVRLFYSGDGNPEVEYTNQTMPGNANQLVISDLPGYDTTSFKVVFNVDGGDTCSFTFDIPYSSIIII